MTEPNNRSFETNNGKINFQAQIDDILSRGISPEVVDTYADDALDDLVSVVEDAVSFYNQSPTIHQRPGQDSERAALVYSGIDPDQIESTLDHIADLADDINELDAFIAKNANNGSVVITPPMEIGASIIPGDGSFKEKAQIPRLKTILILLEKQFGIDLNDESQIYIIPGTVDSKMMRQTPYNLIVLPELNRLINVCDEEGNRTFIFDKEMVEIQGLSPDIIVRMNKGELDAIVNSEPSQGKALQYGPDFTEKVSALLSGQMETVVGEKIELLKAIEYAPQGWLTANAIADRFKVDAGVVKRCIAQLDLRGTTYKLSKTPFSPRKHYSPDDQMRIQKDIGEQPPEGWIHTLEIATKLDIDQGSVTDRAEVLGIERKKYKGAYYYSPEDVETIRESIGEKPPEGWLTGYGLTKVLRTRGITIKKSLIESYAVELGLGTREYRLRSGGKFGGNKDTYYSPDHQKQITDRIGVRPPEDYITLRKLRTEYGGSHRKWDQAVLESDVCPIIFKDTPYYSPFDQERLIKWIKDNTVRRIGTKALEVEN